MKFIDTMGFHCDILSRSGFTINNSQSQQQHCDRNLTLLVTYLYENCKHDDDYGGSHQNTLCLLIHFP